MSQSAADHAKEIRETLKKKHGLTSKRVSVRAHGFSMGESIRVEIKDPAVPFDVVNKIARSHERIRRCEISGDILSGGNLYVDVAFSRECLAEITKKHIEPVRSAILKLKVGSRELQGIPGTPFLVGLNEHLSSAKSLCFTLWRDSFIANAYTPEEIACAIGVRFGVVEENPFESLT